MFRIIVGRALPCLWRPEHVYAQQTQLPHHYFTNPPSGPLPRPFGVQHAYTQPWKAFMHQPDADDGGDREHGQLQLPVPAVEEPHIGGGAHDGGDREHN
jgi:hypothetical protein